LHAVPEELHVEIEEKAGSEAGQLQVGEQLGPMDLMQAFHRFHLHYDASADLEIQPDARVQLQPF
jgi:hypothetical protein